MKLDHLMWACSDLEAGIEEIYELSGVKAEYSGSHRGLGTRNALMSLGEACYLELIAPDPEQSLIGNFGGRLSELTSSGLLAFAMAAQDLSQLTQQLKASGRKVSDVQRTTRDTADGDSLIWELLFVLDVKGAPFYIDWLDCVHPAITSPKGCTLMGLAIEISEPEPFMSLMGGAGPEIQTALDKGAERPRLTARIQSPNGERVLKPLNSDISLF